MSFLPISKKDCKKRGWDYVDFAFVIADAYVDHSSFGPAIISRVLESHGYRVGIIAQPDWKDEKSIDVFGRPRLGFLVSGGNMDSMVNHYTVSKKRRNQDFYSPGGVIGKRPDHATVVYCNLIRKTYKDVPIIIGGIEASLRRLAHYDYWSDSFKRSILMDSQADIITYGMGEKSTIAVADALDSGIDVRDITFVPGTVFKTKDLSIVPEPIILPDYESMKADKLLYAKSFMEQNTNTDPFNANHLVEEYKDFYVVQNPPSMPLTSMEMDDVYELPYEGTYHPCYEAEGGIPAIKEIKFSLTSNRGCFGGCNFCALTFHQGRIVQARSHESLIREATKMTKDPEFKGYIHDVGGPSAEFRRPACDKQLKSGVCKNRQCLFPKACPNLKVDHQDYLQVLRELRSIPGIKKVFVRSGIRFDYALLEKDDSFLKELCKYHVSGQLRVAPEHISDNVLKYMGKPEHKVYLEFTKRAEKINKSLGLNQYAVPYLMSSHPGATLDDAIILAEYLRDVGHQPEQVQDFYPTPSTIATVMYYTGVDPRTMEPVYVAKNPHEKAMQRALMQYRNPENYELVVEALRKAHREDLIGFDSRCLVFPRKVSKGKPGEVKKQSNSSGKGFAKQGDRKNSAKAGGSKQNANNKQRVGSGRPDARNKKANNKTSAKGGRPPKRR